MQTDRSGNNAEETVDEEEMGVMEFIVSGHIFGIHIEQVREVLIQQLVTSIPHTHPAIEGIIRPRDKVITVVNLPCYLGLETQGEAQANNRNLFILAELAHSQAAFRVDDVVEIVHFPLSQIAQPDENLFFDGQGSVALGIVQREGVLVPILDFERILSNLSQNINLLTGM